MHKTNNFPTGVLSPIRQKDIDNEFINMKSDGEAISRKTTRKYDKKNDSLQKVAKFKMQPRLIRLYYYRNAFSANSLNLIV